MRDRRTQRGRSGSVTSSTAGFSGGADPQRESELSVATDNLTIEEIDGNVFRMSKDQVRGAVGPCNASTDREQSPMSQDL